MNAACRVFRAGRLVSLAILLSACFSDEPDLTGGDGGGEAVVIRLTEALRFVPDTLTITRGTRVRWVNESDFFHTVTPRNTSQPGVWSRRETSGRGPVLEHTFSVGGQTYNYFCEPHESFGMVARIRVE